MRAFRFKIPELESFPPEKREATLRRCLDSEEYARQTRRIRRLCFLSAVALAVALANALAWAGVGGNSYVLSALLGLGTVGSCIVLMLLAQVRLQIRLVRKLVRKEFTRA